MYVKLPLGNLNSDPYPPHPTNTYTYGVTIAPRVCDDIKHQWFLYFVFLNVNDIIYHKIFIAHVLHKTLLINYFKIKL